MKSTPAVAMSSMTYQTLNTTPTSSLTVTSLLTIATHFIEILDLCSLPLVGGVKWIQQWEGLATTYAFDECSSLQSRSFVALAAWSSCKHSSISLTSVVEILKKYASVSLYMCDGVCGCVRGCGVGVCMCEGCGMCG